MRHGAGAAAVAVGLLFAGAAAHADVVINEVLGSTTGEDREYIELYNPGPAAVDISGWQVFLYDSDTGSSFGGLDGGSPFAVPAGVTLAVGDHFLFANPLAQTEFGVTADVLLPANAVENSSYTAILKDAGGGIVNAVFVRDTGATDSANHAGVAIVPEFTVGPDGTNLPAGFTRTPDGASTFSLLPFSLSPPSAFTPTPLAGGGGGGGAECSDPVTAIHVLQGSGVTSPALGSTHAIRGVVTGDFQGSPGLRGFFVQEEDADVDADPATSEGIFVFDPATTLPLQPGDVVRVAGTVSEFNGNTQLSSTTSILDCGDAALPAPVAVTLPETANGELERHEGMLVSIATADGAMTVAQNFFLGRYGQMTLSSPDDAGNAGRTLQPTNQFLPLSPEAIALADENARRLLVLDDGFDVNSLGDNPNPVPYLGAPPPAVLRAGDRVENLVGILDQGRINSASPPATDYRLHPTVAPMIVAQNLRTATPDDQQIVGGRLRVAGFNVLNYFTTVDQAGAACFGPDPVPRNNCRGADSASELVRQRDKIVAALTAIDADVVGLIEIENSFGGATPPVADLVAALNVEVGAGTWAWLHPGVDHIGGDAIAVALIYKPARVQLAGNVAILTSAFDADFIDTLNRPAVAATFTEVATGQAFTVAVNHLKSKGSDCNAVGDPDVGDGQGNCNVTRRRAAEVLADWLATYPTGVADPDFMVIGDLNAYAMEDPVRVLRDAGLRDQAVRFANGDAYSYIFDGLSGALDHALASVSLSAQVSGAVHWHVSTDEPAVIDYDQNFNPAGYYAADPYRASDHDPVVVGLDLGSPNAVQGTSRRDTLVGTAGADVISGLAGADTVTGGDGVDVHVYTSVRDGGDLVTDFAPAIDAVDVRPLLQAIGVGGDVLASGHVRIAAGVNGDATVFVDTDGTVGPARATALVRLAGVAASTPARDVLLLP
jgi:hypothetical protein